MPTPCYAYSLLCLLPAMPTPCYGATRYRSTTPAFYGSTFLCLLVLQARLGLEHTMWANSVLASGTATGVVIHTGRETRAAANSARPRMKTKIGSIDLQVNTLAKLLFALTLLTALVMVSVPLLLRWLEYGLKFERETQSLLTQQLLQASLIVSIVSRPMPMPTSKYV
jgi:magnesium-transporting ATPase (P-type)